MGLPKFPPPPGRTINTRGETVARPSIMQALETAVLLMEQSGCTEEDVFKYVHMIFMGWIRDGALAPEYLDLVRQVEQEKRREAEEAARIAALRESAGMSGIITNISG